MPVSSFKAAHGRIHTVSKWGPISSERPTDGIRSVAAFLDREVLEMEGEIAGISAKPVTDEHGGGCISASPLCWKDTHLAD